MPQSDLVLFSVNNRVALITVNDPERRNAVTAEMSTQLRDRSGTGRCRPRCACRGRHRRR